MKKKPDDSIKNKEKDHSESNSFSFNEIDNFFNELFKDKSEMLKIISKKIKSLENDKDLGNILTVRDFFDFSKDYLEEFLKDKEIRDNLQELINLIIKDLDKMFSYAYILSKEIYDNFKSLFIKAFNKHNSHTWEIIQSYYNSKSTLISIDNVLNSLMIFREIKPKIKELFDVKLDDAFIQNLENWFKKMMEKYDKDKYKMLLFDWILKFGYILESHYKNVMISLLKLDYLLKEKDFREIDKKFNTIGKIENELKEEHLISKFRNAIFHSNFIVNYNINLEERKIIFQDRDKILELDILVFIVKFFQLIKLINIFESIPLIFIPTEDLIEQINDLFEVLKFLPLDKIHFDFDKNDFFR